MQSISDHRIVLWRIRPPRGLVFCLVGENTGNLDRDTQNEIMQIFRSLAEQGKCVILVSHAPDVAAVCDETYQLVKLSRKGKK